MPVLPKYDVLADIAIEPRGWTFADLLRKDIERAHLELNRQISKSTIRREME